MSEIVLEGVTKRFGGTTAVDGVSLRADKGRFMVLLGPSGCGKSTLLRLIAGLEEVSEGKIFIEGRDVTALDPTKRKLSMVFQSYALFPHLTVAENIVFGLKVRRLPADQRAARLKRVAELVGLTERLDHKPQQLSGGQRQRVALARAIVSENPICLMDEPLSNLDAQLRQEMRAEIRALQRRLNMTVIYVTHDQVEAMSMADQVILLRAGRVEQAGTPAELYARPASTFAARFIGTPAMNLVPLQAIQPEAARGLTAGIRPEHIKIVSNGSGVAATVVSAEYHGADTVVTARVGDTSLLVRAPGEIGLAPGSQVRLGWEPAAVHLFDSEKGLRI
ncbi:MAG TPA: ABC transporter ATP-binding protein [Burkholderiales bacterium]|nr:ABC transporter ATP-binding protein [Burkholderiales bacterium]